MQCLSWVDRENKSEPWVQVLSKTPCIQLQQTRTSSNFSIHFSICLPECSMWDHCARVMSTGWDPLGEIEHMRYSGTWGFSILQRWCYLKGSSSFRAKSPGTHFGSFHGETIWVLDNFKSCRESSLCLPRRQRDFWLLRLLRSKKSREVPRCVLLDLLVCCSNFVSSTTWFVLLELHILIYRLRMAFSEPFWMICRLDLLKKHKVSACFSLIVGYPKIHWFIHGISPLNSLL